MDPGNREFINEWSNGGNKACRLGAADEAQGSRDAQPDRGRSTPTAPLIDAYSNRTDFDGELYYGCFTNVEGCRPFG
ncbi:MAG: hypothetical protein SGI86_06045 [Deltaproteobacteria bacterium]|nr:hypothetical protein [Deltaproteobacteria bacterium]